MSSRKQAHSRLQRMSSTKQAHGSLVSLSFSRFVRVLSFRSRSLIPLCFSCFAVVIFALFCLFAVVLFLFVSLSVSLSLCACSARLALFALSSLSLFSVLSSLSWVPFGCSLVPFGCFWVPFGCLLGALGRLLGSLGLSWGVLGVLLGRSWAVLGRSGGAGRFLVDFLSDFGANLAPKSVPKWDQNRCKKRPKIDAKNEAKKIRNKTVLGPSWGDLRPILASSWGRFW